MHEDELVFAQVCGVLGLHADVKETDAIFELRFWRYGLASH